MLAKRWLRGLMLCLALAAPRGARAQDLSTSLATVLSNSIDALHANIDNRQVFVPDFNFNEFLTTEALRSALVSEVGSFPLGSSSGGFTYVFDSSQGVAVRRSPSFGPAFAERGFTSGRGTFNLGVTYLRRRFTHLEGKNLEDGEIKFGTRMAFAANPDLNADLIESTMSLKVDTQTANVTATYGVTDVLDVGVAVPFQSISVDANVSSRLVRFPQIPVGVATIFNTATGVGDIALRAKYNVFNTSTGAVAAGVDLRLPTGDEDNLLGTGATRVNVYGAVSTGVSRVFPHANVGYTFTSTDEAFDSRFVFGASPEFNYTFGSEFVVTERLTLIGDLVGRSISEGRLTEEVRTIDLVGFAPPSPPAETRKYTELTFDFASPRLNQVLGTVGAKWNPRSTFIIAGHLLFSLTEAGIRSRVTPVIAVDYTF